MDRTNYADIVALTTLEAVEVPSRPDSWASDTPMYHFHCTLRYKTGSHVFYFSQGLAHNTGKLRRRLGVGNFARSWAKVTIPEGDKRFIKSAWGQPVEVTSIIDTAKRRGDKDRFADLIYEPTPPTVRGVLSSLLLDVRAGEMSFEEFCSDFGYDTDSRKAHKTWEACSEAMRGLTNLYGRRELQALMDHCEEIENEPETQAD
jgi:hypothetical protein